MTSDEVRSNPSSIDRLMSRHRPLATTAVLGVAAIGVYVLVVRGALTLDLGVGRSIRRLGPISRSIAAPRELVFDVIAAPYRGRTSRALERKLRVLERGEGMVLAEHFTHVGPLVTTTVETVRFERPHHVHFRLVRGPVPYVAERFELHETDDGTRLEYSGELGTDLWSIGRVWGAATAQLWERAVERSLDAIVGEAERRAATIPHG